MACSSIPRKPFRLESRMSNPVPCCWPDTHHRIRCGEYSCILRYCPMVALNLAERRRVSAVSSLPNRASHLGGMGFRRWLLLLTRIHPTLLYRLHRIPSPVHPFLRNRTLLLTRG